MHFAIHRATSDVYLSARGPVGAWRRRIDDPHTAPALVTGGEYSLTMPGVGSDDDH